MRRRTQLIIGGIVIAWGLLLLIGNLLNVDIGRFIGPLLLIALGLWVLLRPRIREKGNPTVFRLLGDVRRRGPWRVRDEELWCLVGDIRLDLTEAEIPPGETTIKLAGFVNGITVVVPENVGVAVNSTAFVTEARMFGYKQDYLLTGYEGESDNYAEANQKIRLELLYFVADLKVRHPTV
jgi:lia operon protein LiaF